MPNATTIEHSHWVLSATGPNQDECHVKYYGTVLYRFKGPGANVNAMRLREWYVQREYKRYATYCPSGGATPAG